MTIWPRSLFGRNALLIVALMIVGQLISFGLVRQLVVRPRFELLSESLARNIGAIRSGLASLPSEQRQVFVDQFNLRALAAPLPRASRLPSTQLTPIEREFIRSVSERVASEGGEIVWRRDAGGSIAVRLTLDGAGYWIVLPGLVPAREFSGAWVAASLSCVALALVAALLVQRHLHRPLVNAVQAAHTLAAGAIPPPLAENGPTEVATLARSFNQMVRSLDQAEHDRSLMLAGISHDLRTPLTKLRLGLEILGAKEEPGVTASMTRSIEEMDAVVGQFLHFARHEPFEATPPVRMQREPLRRAIVNLVENAFRHGRAPVELRVGEKLGQIHINVVDHGDGLPVTELEAVKKPFKRGSPARDGTPGSGLGLAIVERIARDHGGRLVLSLARGGGLNAALILPLA